MEKYNEKAQVDENQNDLPRPITAKDIILEE